MRLSFWACWARTESGHIAAPSPAMTSRRLIRSPRRRGRGGRAEPMNSLRLMSTSRASGPALAASEARKCATGYQHCYKRGEWHGANHALAAPQAYEKPRRADVGENRLLPENSG